MQLRRLLMPLRAPAGPGYHVLVTVCPLSTCCLNGYRSIMEDMGVVLSCATASSKPYVHELLGVARSNGNRKYTRLC